MRGRSKQLSFGAVNRAAAVVWPVFLLLLQAACSSGPSFQAPDLIGQQHEKWQAVRGVQLVDRQPPARRWWNQFADPQLIAMVERVFASNLVLEQARERVIEATARHGVVASEKRLQLAAALGYTRAESGDDVVSLRGIPPGKTLDVYSTGFVAGWEFDLWGRTGRLLEAAEQEIRISQEEYRGLLVSLAAELTKVYIEVRGLESRLALVEENIVSQLKTLELAKVQLAAGSTTELVVVRAERLVAGSRARVPELRRQLEIARNRLSILQGLPPGAAVLEAGSLPRVPDMIGVGIPADLMTRRPDIMLAMAAYHAAVARTGAAQAQRYPSLHLSGTLTLSSDSLGKLFGPEALLYTLGPELTFPLLTGGRIDSAVAVRQSQAEQARLGLEQLLLEALTEVEDSAAGVVRSQEQVQRLVETERLAQKSVDLSNELYRAGLTDLFQVLDNQQQLLGIQESLAVARQQALSQVVGLYRALGGGWEEAPPAIGAGEVAGGTGDPDSTTGRGWL